MERFVPELLNTIAQYRVFSKEYYSFMMDYTTANIPVSNINFVKSLLKELKSDLLVVTFNRIPCLTKVDYLIVSNSPAQHLVLVDVVRSLMAKNLKVGYIGPTITTKNEEDSLSCAVKLTQSEVLLPVSFLAFLRLWLSFPLVFIESVILWLRTKLAYKKIAKTSIRVPIFKYVSHLMTLKRCAWTLRCLAPKKILLGLDFERFGGAVAIAGYKQSAEIMVLQHGVLNPINVDSIATSILCWTKDICSYVKKKQKSQGSNRTPFIKARAIGAIYKNSEIFFARRAKKKTVLFLDQQAARVDWQIGKTYKRVLASWLRDLQDAICDVEWRVRVRANYSNYLSGSWMLAKNGNSLEQDLESSFIVITMNSTAGVIAGAQTRPVVFMWSPKMPWFNSMAPLKELFVCSSEKLILRVTRLLNDECFYKEYTEKCVSLCRKYLGFPKRAVDGLVSLITDAS